MSLRSPAHQIELEYTDFERVHGHPMDARPQGCAACAAIPVVDMDEVRRKLNREVDLLETRWQRNRDARRAA